MVICRNKRYKKKNKKKEKIKDYPLYMIIYRVEGRFNLNIIYQITGGECLWLHNIRLFAYCFVLFIIIVPVKIYIIQWGFVLTDDTLCLIVKSWSILPSEAYQLPA